jgi:hypothetical protein
MTQSEQPQLTRRNFLFGGGLFCTAAVAWGGVELFAESQSAATVTVMDSEHIEHSYSLNEDATHTITTAAGTNVIKIADGQVCVESSDCPNQRCVNQGHIHQTGQTIVCLPHKLVVTITNDVNNSPPVVDTISG